MFDINSQESFPEREERILAFWKSQNIFEKSVDQNRSNPVFSVYDGPPFATGLPHYGHILAGTIKDVIPRYKTMQGYFVPRRFGWDCHGLPVENEIEKAKELSGASCIEIFGISSFNEECRNIVMRYTKEWEYTVMRMGRFVSFTDTWRTMDLSFMESVWWVFAQLYQKGLVYEGYKVMPFSAQLGTPLSNFEANLNYKEVDDPSLTVLFSLVDEPNTSFVVWTTTPWTLPSNLAIMVHENFDYVKIRQEGHDYILAHNRLGHYFKEGKYEIIAIFKGSSLVSKRYQPLFPYFAHYEGFRVITEVSISSEEGTGLVHAAPAFGEVDFYACSKEGIEVVCPVDHNGKFTKLVPDYEGLFVKDADKEIIRRLKKEGKVLQHTQIRHRYPFCWRSDTPLIYRAVCTWFVAVEKIKNRMMDANQKVQWVPHHLKKGRFGKWLENARDWAISRNRYWGTPIPIWRSEDGEIIVLSSIEELRQRTGVALSDLHRHYIDSLTFIVNDKEFKRIPEVFDCWFESGSMPYAQNHYPFEKKQETRDRFPADFIAEGLDQTRGWFYTLMVIATALFDQPAFKNVIVNGIILAEDGNKMSKRLKNYPEPQLIFNRYGADAVRLYLLSSPVVHAEDLRFSERGVELVLRQMLIPFWNSVVFLSTYAKIYRWDPKEIECSAPQIDIDRWILSCLQGLIQEVTDGLDRYELHRAVDPFVKFIDQLTNWYIRRNRSRFWAEEDTIDRKLAFETLYTVLINLAKIAAPFIPFLSEGIYLYLKTNQDPQSVHLCSFPIYNPVYRDRLLEEQMSYVQTVVSMGHALRKESKLKVRQPLRSAFVVSSDLEILKQLQSKKQLIADELNVKEVVFKEDETAFVQLLVKPNFRVLGKKIGKLMSAVKMALENFSQKELNQLLEENRYELVIKEEIILLSSDDIIIERRVKEGLVASTIGSMVIAIDTVLDEELLLEGLARELVNKVNAMRRDLSFAVSDRIEIYLNTTEKVKRALSIHRDYVMTQILGVKLEYGSKEEGSVWDINGEKTFIAIARWE
ncbi:MAG: isoleucine--tRNA ligase [Chlamydiales bacterium]|jgi:isoleucyl-tRNA synthetase|nr:isoleucine--tRNA ligase [Chlamydiales bacterium]